MVALNKINLGECTHTSEVSREILYMGSSGTVALLRPCSLLKDANPQRLLVPCVMVMPGN